MENANKDPLATNLDPDLAIGGEPMPDQPLLDPPMDAPRVVLAVLGGFFVVLLGGLMLIDAFWAPHGSVTVASPAPQTISAPAATG